MSLPIRRCAFWSRNWARDFRTNATQHSLKVTDKITLLIIWNRLEFFSDDLKLLTWQHNIVANDNANESQKEFVLCPYCFKQTVWRKGLCLCGIKLLKVVHLTNVLPLKYIYNGQLQVSSQKLRSNDETRLSSIFVSPQCQPAAWLKNWDETLNALA